MFDITCLDSYGEVITNLTQWDVNQSLTIKNTGLTSAPLFHFCNKNSKEALVVKSTLEDNTITVKIPNILLQEGIPIIVYLYAYSSLTSGKTLATVKIPVRPRPKPSDYEYVGNIDVISLALIEDRINDVIQSMEDTKKDVETRVATVEVTIVNLQKEINKKIPTSQKGAANGVATLDSNGLVPSSQLPSYVDDVIEGTLSTFPSEGDSGKIYVDTFTNLTYRWSGSGYVEISKSIALGETSSTAYPGNKGKQNADDIANLKTRVSTNESNITTLQSNVSSNTTDINTLKSNVSTNTADIANIKSDVSGIKTDISNIKDDISTAENDISSLRTDVDNNASDIDDIQQSLNSQSNDISNLKTTVSGHTEDISDLKSTTSKNASDISSLTGRVTTNETDIDNIQGNIQSMMSDLTSIKNGEMDVAGSGENSIDIDGHIIYGAYFCDVDENNHVFLREDGSGNYIIATAINKTVFAKDLSGRISTTLDNIIERIAALERMAITAE